MCPFALDIEAIEQALAVNAPLLPELTQVLASPGGLAVLPAAQQALTDTA